MSLILSPLYCTRSRSHVPCHTYQHCQTISANRVPSYMDWTRMSSRIFIRSSSVKSLYPQHNFILLTSNAAVSHTFLRQGSKNNLRQVFLPFLLIFLMTCLNIDLSNSYESLLFISFFIICTKTITTATTISSDIKATTS